MPLPETSYIPAPELVWAFGKHWRGPAVLEPNKETLLAAYPPRGDGRPVKVFCTACPSLFFRIEAEATATGYAFELSTGSGVDMGMLSASIAAAIADGMLGPTHSSPNVGSWQAIERTVVHAYESGYISGHNDTCEGEFNTDTGFVAKDRTGGILKALADFLG